VNSFFFRKKSFIYEIYPQSETPHLTQIAHLDLTGNDYLLLPGTLIWFTFYEAMVVFWVWDYRLNRSISFSVDVDVDKFEYKLKVNFFLSKVLKCASNSLVGR
jgi:hypothetical protein